MRRAANDVNRTAESDQKPTPPTPRDAPVDAIQDSSEPHSQSDLLQALRQAEARAEEAERRLRRFAEALVETNGQWMWALSADGESASDFSGAMRFTGQRAEFPSALWWIELIHPDDQQRARTDWQKSLATGTPFENVQRVRRADGEYRYMHVRALPMRDEHGALTEWVGSTIDITERKRLEREATERGGQFEAIFDAMADGVLIYDEQGAIVRANHAARELMGYDRRPTFYERPAEERAAEYTLADAEGNPVPPGDVPIKRILRGEVLTGSRSEDYHVRTLDGRMALVNLSGAPVRVEGERVTGAVIVMRDVEQRRRLERELEQQAREIVGVIEGIPDGVAVYGPTGEVRYMNAAYRALLTLDEDEIKRPLQARAEAIIPRDPVTGESLPQDQWPGMRIHHGDVLVGPTSVDVLVRSHDGRDVYLNCAGGPIKDESGAVLGAVMVIRDVEERRRLERRTGDALAALLAMAEALLGPAAANAPSTETAPGVTQRRRSPVAQRLAELTRDVLGCSRVGITAIDPETRLMRAEAVVGLTPQQEVRWWEEQAAQERQGARLGDGADPAELARFEAGETFVIDMTKPPFDAAPNPYGITTSLIAPMRADDAVVGMLSLDFGGPAHDFTEEEKALTGAVANLAA